MPQPWWMTDTYDHDYSIPAGRRNNTLFAIGQQMKLAQVPDWDTHLHARAVAVGLDNTEADKLVANVRRYN